MENSDKIVFGAVVLIGLMFALVPCFIRVEEEKE